MFVEFEWDSQKAAINLKKHGIDFAEAAMVCYDELAVTIRDTGWDEDRFVSIGMDAVARILVVSFTWRGNRIRIISARKATPRERQEYESCL
jgi:uncharacterized DUF497 family protein